jgi:WD40 repeat protein
MVMPALAQTEENAGQIVFVCVIEDQWDICVMNPDGSGLLRLTNDPNFDYMPRFSSDGSQVVFASQPIRGGSIGVVNHMQPEEIYVMRADSSQRQRLTWHLGFATAPTWSPEGTRIAYHVWTADTDEFFLQTLDLASRVQVQLVERAVLPMWSPNGSRIAYVHTSERGRLIYVMDTDGSHIRQLSLNESYDSHPCWSPDGTQIAFSRREDEDWDIYLMNADGSDVQQLTDGHANDYPFGWSPDGQYVMFGSTRAAPYLFMLNLENGSIEPLALPEGIMGDPYLGGVDWSVTAHVTEVAPPVTAEENILSGLWMETWAESERVCRSGEQRRSFSNQPFLLNVAADGDELEINYLLTGETFRLPRIEPDIYYGTLDGNGGEAFGESHVAWLTHMEYAFIETFNEDCFISNGAAWDFVTDGAYCTLTALGTPNLRSGPGTTYQRVGTLAAGESTIAITQTTGDDGYVWYQLYDNKWIRSDLVEAEASCADLPTP